MPAGTHSCALYSGATERERVRSAFLREGLQNGDRCLGLVDHVGPAPRLERLSSADTGHGGDCAIHRASDVCLQAGQFSVTRTTSFLAARAAHAAQEGFPQLRVIVDMGWLLRQSRAVDDLLAFESAVDPVVEQGSAVVMCAYDLECFGVETLVEALRTHERVLLDGAVLLNPRYRAEREEHPSWVGDQGRPGRATAGTAWSSLTDSELRIVARVVDGLTNREIARLLVVSRHTVDAHLKHIYIKLGIHTRVELTVLALQHSGEG